MTFHDCLTIFMCGEIFTAVVYFLSLHCPKKCWTKISNCGIL